MSEVDRWKQLLREKDLKLKEAVIKIELLLKSTYYKYAQRDVDILQREIRKLQTELNAQKINHKTTEGGVMPDKKKGLYQEYEVKKLNNPEKKVDAIVLEFDNELARDAILKWAECVLEAGYVELHNDIIGKLAEIDPTPWCTGCNAMSSEDCDCGPIAENN